MIKLILHSIRMRPTQSASVVFMVCVGVAVLFLFALLSSGVNDGVRLATERGGAQILVLPVKANPYLDDDGLLFSGAPITMYMDASVRAQVLDTKGVLRATGQFYSQTLDASCCSASGETRLIGVDSQTDWLIPTLITETTDPTKPLFPLAADEIIIGSNVDGYEKGSGRLLGNDVHVAARLVSTGTAFDHSIIIDIDVARHLSSTMDGYDYLWEQYGPPNELISAVLVDAQPGQTEVALERLNALPKVRAIARSSIIERSQEQLQTQLMVLLGMGIVMMFASLLQLFARYYSVAWERKSEFALYLALGATKTTIRRLICGEACILTGIGLLVGLGVGGGMFALFIAQVLESGAFPFIFPPLLFIAIAAGAFIVLFYLATLLALIIPLWRMTRIEPSLALQQLDIG